MSKSPSYRLFPILCVCFAALAACGASSTAPGGDQEIISRVTLTLTPSTGGAPIIVYVDDPDGSGPIPPSAQVGAMGLTVGTSYAGTVLFENRLVSPAQNISSEVAGEANAHRVFYSGSGAAVTVVATDSDGSGRALGLAYTLTAGANTGTGSLRVVLCHYSNVTKPAIATSCTDDTDIDVSFNYTIANSTTN